MVRQQQVFNRPDPMRIRLVLGEAAFLTVAGPPDLMAAQHQHLRDQAGRDQVDIRVLPFTAGLYPGIRGPFSVLQFPDPDDPPVAYVETYEGSRYPERPPQVARYRRRFERIWALAVPLEEYSR